MDTVNSNLKPDDVQKISKIWNVVKQIIEIILVAIGGSIVSLSADACGFSNLIVI